MQITNQTDLFLEDESLCEPDDEYKNSIYTVVYSLVFVIGLISNLTALYVFCRKVKRKSVGTVCLLNLAAADILFILTLPFRISYYHSGASWRFGDGLCRISVCAFYISMTASIFFLTLFSVVRYVSLIRCHVVTVKKVIFICVLVWIVATVGNSPFILSGTFVRDNVTRCFEPSGLTSWTRIMYMNYVALVLGFSVPFAAILISNGLLIKHIMQNNLKKEKAKKHIIMIALVFLVFCVCFLPYHIQRTLHLHYLVHHRTNCSLHRMLQKTVVATLCLAVANSCLDPLLYVFLGQGFKAWLRLLSRKLKQSSQSSSSSAKNGAAVHTTVIGLNFEMTSLSAEEKDDASWA